MANAFGSGGQGDGSGTPQTYGEWVQGVPVLGDLHNAFVGAPAQKPSEVGDSPGITSSEGGAGSRGNLLDSQGRPMSESDQQGGYWIDPTTGRTFVGEPRFNGQMTVVTNPNVAQMIARNMAKSGEYGARAASGDAEHAQTFGQQSALADSFRNTINNPNAASVAGVQLGQSTDALARRQMAGAAGVNGQNAFAARRQALQNIAGGAAQADQAAALLRAKETTDAQSGLGTLLNSMSTGTDRRYVNDTGLEKDYLESATRGSAARENLTYGSGEQDRANSEKRGAGFINWASNMVGANGEKK